MPTSVDEHEVDELYSVIKEILKEDEKGRTNTIITGGGGPGGGGGEDWKCVLGR
jgi:hypothetical protein